MSLPGDGLPEALAAPAKDGAIVVLLNGTGTDKDIAIDFSALGLDVNCRYNV